MYKWRDYKEETGKIRLVQLGGCETKAIEKEVARVTEALTRAIENHVPKIRHRFLPPPEIDEETKELVREAKNTKIKMVNGIDYFRNGRKLVQLSKSGREKK